MGVFLNGVRNWLLERALRNDPLEETVAQLGRRLIDGGLPVARISIGRVMLHPALGVATLEWEVGQDRAQWDITPSDALDGAAMRNTPFGRLRVDRGEHYYADLTDPAQVAEFPLFGRLADRSMTGYAAYGRLVDDENKVLPQLPELSEGCGASFSTSRFGGFSETERETLGELALALFVCVRIATEQTLVSRLMETYLGRLSGQKVLTGQSTRGDGQSIDCALFFSDLRGSLRLSSEQPPEAFLDTVNRYFDCVAGPVLAHGGEVLKFIGDGVLAIFPFDDAARPRENMCRAALSAAREAFQRADHLNARRAESGAPEIGFGIALHVGSVIYGNVGVTQRLDFTATGPAVGIASRCEAMTRELDHALIATEAFADACPEAAQPLGKVQLRGLDRDIGLFSYPCEKP